MIHSRLCICFKTWHTKYSCFLPANWLISDFDCRISSASFCAVGRTFVWCSAMRYWANFWSCSLSIWSRVSEIGRRSWTSRARRILCRDSATTCWHQKMSRLPHVHVTAVILQRSKLIETRCLCSGSYSWLLGSLTVPLRWKPGNCPKKIINSVKRQDQNKINFEYYIYAFQYMSLGRAVTDFMYLFIYFLLDNRSVH